MALEKKIRLFKGLNTKLEDYLIREGQLTDMRNMQSRDGILNKRKGYDIATKVGTDTDQNLYFPSHIFFIDTAQADAPDDNLLFSSFKPLEGTAMTPTVPSTPNKLIITAYKFGIELEDGSGVLLLESGDKLLLE